MSTYTSPGLYLEDIRPAGPQRVQTAIPVFIGYARHHHEVPYLLQDWPQFTMRFGEPVQPGYLAYAVRGFFDNGGKFCYVLSMEPAESAERALLNALKKLDSLQEADLVCAPDLGLTHSGEARPAVELAGLQAVLIHPGPELGDSPTLRRFLILDSPPGLDPAAERQHCAVLVQAAKDRGATELELAGAAMYYPWVAAPCFTPPNETRGVGAKVETVKTPPCGHIAGVYARTDAAAGIRKAPANEILEGVLDVDVHLSDKDQGSLFVTREDERVPPGAVNCIRAFPGRGIRIWGARTLSSEVEWRYVNVRRLFINAVRSIERLMAPMTFESSTPDLWARIRRELNAYCLWLFRNGALKGTTTNQAFYVRCDETVNPRELRDQGMVVAEVGLAAARPYEFIVIRVVQRDGGISLTSPGAAGI